MIFLIYLPIYIACPCPLNKQNNIDNYYFFNMLAKYCRNSICKHIRNNPCSTTDSFGSSGLRSKNQKQNKNHRRMISVRHQKKKTNLAVRVCLPCKYTRTNTPPTNNKKNAYAPALNDWNKTEQNNLSCVKSTNVSLFRVFYELIYNNRN